MVEREVEIKKIFWKFLLSWKTIILVSLILALVFPYLLFAKSKMDYNKQKNDIRKKYRTELEKIIAEEVQDYSDVELSEDDQNKVDLAIAYREQIDTLRNYKDTSPIFMIDPYNVQCVSLTYYVDVKDDMTSQEIQAGVVDTRANAVSNMYKRYVTADEFVVNLLGDKINDVGASFAKELISYAADADVFFIEIMIFDDMDAETTYAKADELIRSKVKDFSVVGECEVELLVGDISYKRKTAMLDKRNEINNQIASTEKDLNSVLKDMTPAQIYFFEKEHRTEEAIREEFNLDRKVATDSEGLTKPILKKKLAIVGALGGIVLAFIIVFAKDMFSSKLVYDTDIESVYKIKSFGNIDKEGAKKKFIIDRLIIAIRDRKKRTLSSEEKLEVLTTSIVLKCKNQDINKVCLTSSSLDSVGKQNLEKVKEILTKKNISVEVVDEIYYDSKALGECAECGEIIIVEAVGKSLYEEITKEVNKAKEYNIDILGAVIVEG